MLEKVELFVALVMLFVAVFCIFNARGIVKSKVENENINKIVIAVKITATFIAILSLVAIYFIR